MCKFNNGSISTNVQIQQQSKFNKCQEWTNVQIQQQSKFMKCPNSTNVQIQQSPNSTTVQFQRMSKYFLFTPENLKLTRDRLQYSTWPGRHLYRSVTPSPSPPPLHLYRHVPSHHKPLHHSNLPHPLPFCPLPLHFNSPQSITRTPETGYRTIHAQVVINRPGSPLLNPNPTPPTPPLSSSSSPFSPTHPRASQADQRPATVQYMPRSSSIPANSAASNMFSNVGMMARLHVNPNRNKLRMLSHSILQTRIRQNSDITDMGFRIYRIYFDGSRPKFLSIYPKSDI